MTQPNRNLTIKETKNLARLSRNQMGLSRAKPQGEHCHFEPFEGLRISSERNLFLVPSHSLGMPGL